MMENIEERTAMGRKWEGEVMGRQAERGMFVRWPTWRKEKLLICSFLQPSVTSSLLGLDILLSTRFLNTLNL
jgi:hypothetical protein